jgi:hypothetical protein
MATLKYNLLRNGVKILFKSVKTDPAAQFPLAVPPLLAHSLLV